MNPGVSEKWEPLIRAKLKSGHQRSAGEVIDEALCYREQHDAEHSASRANAEVLLIEGLDSGPATPMTPEDWDEIQRERRRLIAAHQSQTRKGDAETRKGDAANTDNCPRGLGRFAAPPAR